MTSLNKLTETLKALGNERRLKILSHLLKGELNGAALAKKLKTSKQSVSEHLERLEEAGIVAARTSGRSTYFSVCKTKDVIVKAVLKEL